MRNIPRTGETWYFSSRFEAINVAVESGIPRMSEWDALDEMDKVYLIARYRTMQRMSAYEEYVRERKMRQLQSGSK